MARYAVVDDGVVTNIVVADSKLQSNWERINDNDDIRIGYIQTQPGGTFSAPTVSIDEQRKTWYKSRAKFALATANSGIITDNEAKAWAGGRDIPAAVQTAIDLAYPNGGEDKLAAEVEVLTAKYINRVHPLLLILQQNMSITDDVADDLFR